jgi:predicted negative regulator of RcsB-dependent stress response
MSKRRPQAHKSHHEEAEDAFVTNVLQAGKWAEANQQLLTIAVVVIAIGVGALLYFRSYRQNLAQQASTELEQVYQSVSINDLEGARTQLGTFLERFGGTPYEAEARLLLGDLYLRDGSPEQAEAVLRPLGASPREPIEFQGAALLAAALEEDRQWDEAQQVYLRIADRSDLDFQVRDALAAAARIRSAQGDTQGAVALYERLLDRLDENDPQRGLYEMRIEEIKAATNT